MKRQIRCRPSPISSSGEAMEMRTWPAHMFPKVLPGATATLCSEISRRANECESRPVEEMSTSR